MCVCVSWLCLGRVRVDDCVVWKEREGLGSSCGLWIVSFGARIDVVALVLCRKRSDCSVSQVCAVLAEALVSLNCRIM